MTQTVVEIGAVEHSITPLRDQLHTVSADVAAIETNYEDFTPAVGSTSEIKSSTKAAFDYLLYAYGSVVLLLSFFFVRRLARLGLVYRSSKQDLISGVRVRSQSQLPTSSFFKIIFWNPSQHQSTDTQTVLAHELVHCRQWHSLDVMLMQLMSIVVWFNPLLHWAGRDLRMQHEFIADRVAKKNAGSPSYVQTLLRHLPMQSSIKLASPAVPFASSIRRRIAKLAEDSDPPLHLIKYFFLLPVLVGVVLLFSQNRENKTMPFLEPESECLFTPSLQLGDLTIDLFLEKNGIGNAYVGSSSLNYRDINRNLHESFRSLCKDSPIMFDQGVTVLLHGRSKDGEVRKELEFYTPKAIFSAFEHELQNEEDQLTFIISGHLTKHPFTLRIDLNVWQQRADRFLVFKDVRYPLSLYGHLNVNAIPLDDFAALVGKNWNRSSTDLETSVQIESPEGLRTIHTVQDAQFTIVEGECNQLTQVHFWERTKTWTEMEHPIVVTIAGLDGHLHHVAFGKSATPVISFKNLEQAGRSPYRFPYSRILYETPINDIKWGPAYRTASFGSNPSRFGFQYRLPLYVDGRPLDTREVPVALAKEMMSAIPLVGHSKLEPAIINFKYTDRVGVPFDCQSRRGKEMPECLQAVIDRLKPGDFIGITEVFDAQGNSCQYVPLTMRIIE